MLFDALKFNYDIASKQKTRKLACENWMPIPGESYQQFAAKLKFIHEQKQKKPFLYEGNGLTQNLTLAGDRYQGLAWHDYFVPHISAAKRASNTPAYALCPDHSNQKSAHPDMQMQSLFCSVLIPHIDHLTPRQKRWLDLLKLKPSVVNENSCCVHLFKKEYDLLRWLEVFTLAHPLKVMSIPVLDLGPYAKRLIQDYDQQFLLLPYFNKRLSNQASGLLYCDYQNGFSQHRTDSQTYKALADAQLDIIARYERCHQLQSIAVALMLGNGLNVQSAKGIDPFSIRFAHDTQIKSHEINVDMRLAKNKNSNQEAQVLLDKQRQMHCGNLGIYQTLLINNNAQDKQVPKSGIGNHNFFLAAMHCGLLPDDDALQHNLVDLLKIKTHRAAYDRLKFNMQLPLAIFQNVFYDDQYIDIYIKNARLSDFMDAKNSFGRKLSSSTQPLELLRRYLQSDEPLTS